MEPNQWDSWKGRWGKKHIKKILASFGKTCIDQQLEHTTHACFCPHSACRQNIQQKTLCSKLLEPPCKVGSNVN